MESLSVVSYGADTISENEAAALRAAIECHRAVVAIQEDEDEDAGHSVAWADGLAQHSALMLCELIRDLSPRYEIFLNDQPEVTVVLHFEGIEYQVGPDANIDDLIIRPIPGIPGIPC